MTEVEKIIGLFFHSYNSDGEIEWQGQVVGMQAGYLIIEIYDWLVGINITRKVVLLSKAVNWTFYKTSEEMRDAYDLSCGG